MSGLPLNGYLFIDEENMAQEFMNKEQWEEHLFLMDIRG